MDGYHLKQLLCSVLTTKIFLVFACLRLSGSLVKIGLATTMTFPQTFLTSSTMSSFVASFDVVRKTTTSQVDKKSFVVVDSSSPAMRKATLKSKFKLANWFSTSSSSKLSRLNRSCKNSSRSKPCRSIFQLIEIKVQLKTGLNPF